MSCFKKETWGLHRGTWGDVAHLIERIFGDERT